MMALELLLWSADNGGPAAHGDMAIQHAITTAREHIRPDGSTYQAVDFDPVTGLPAPRSGERDAHRTFNGLNDQSTWAQGQAWGLYGFTVVYRYTRDQQFRDAAVLMADWYINHLPADFVPYWDFDAATVPGASRDSSAAAVAASALMELCTFVQGADRIRYFSAAESTLLSLAGPGYLAQGSGEPSILLHATNSFTAPMGADVGVIWGDAYFLEGLLRYDAFLASLTPGDADLDGDVDLDDFVILKTNFGAGISLVNGDFDFDGDVDLDDFVILKNNFGTAGP